MQKNQFLSIFFIILLIALIASCEKDEQEVPTLEEKIGQMLLVGFRGTELDASNHIISDLEDYNLGGVILYEKDGPSQSRPRNIESTGQVHQLVLDLKTHSREKLFVAIDQEGGVVDRLKATYGFPETVSAQYLGELNNEDSTRNRAAVLASTLQSMGINVNFAPVVDLNVNPESPAIGALGRSFSANPDTVVFHAGIFIDEHQKRGILNCCKHFPGHGSATADSHLGLTDVTQTWSEIELEPYRQLIDAGKCPMVMSAHVFNQNLDTAYPATLSHEILTGILRGQLGFNGVIVSDAMEMKAITEQYGQEEAIGLAINAGCDILVFSNNISEYNPDVVPDVVSIILELVDKGKISEQRIDQSYERIMLLKSNI
ncbi:MAG: glycoside hydrolase family 3 protein [Prolixibacteraceae bacterium]|nr:glycoside hydrolase family 3 protein [Prolixibacteraceae bacterium]